MDMEERMLLAEELHAVLIRNPELDEDSKRAIKKTILALRTEEE